MGEAKNPVRTTVVKGVRAKIAKPEDHGTIFASNVIGHIGRGEKLPALEIRTGDKPLNFVVRDTLTMVEARVDLTGALDGIADSIRGYLEREVEWQRRLAGIGKANAAKINGRNGN